MSQQSILDKIRQQVQNANQGNNTAQNPTSPAGGFSISNGMMQSLGAGPKTLSSSYLS